MATHMILPCFVSHRTDYVYVCRRRINLPKHLLSGEEDPRVTTSPMGAEENDASVAISVKAAEVTTRVE
jgi:surfactin synthase thioesterase subunit